MKKHNYRGEFNCWSDGKDRWDSNSVASNFEITLPEPEYVWAQYDAGSYEGSAIVENEGGRDESQVAAPKVRLTAGLFSL